jgi:hypothetical protein
MKELNGQFNLFQPNELKAHKICFMCKEKLEISNFYKDSNGKISAYCHKCYIVYSADYREKNKKTIKRKEQEKLSTAEGSMKMIFIQIKNKVNAKRRSYKKKGINMSERELLQYYECKVTDEELLEIWNKQFAVYGMHCPISKQVMTFLRANTGRSGPGSSFSNTVSIDRLDPNHCYEKDNIIFIANEVNMRKNKVNYNDCIRIIELHKERFPERFK